MSRAKLAICCVRDIRPGSIIPCEHSSGTMRGVAITAGLHDLDDLKQRFQAESKYPVAVIGYSVS